ncbi:YbaK/EbsC family protein [Sphingopyxis sp.]|uniref:aminoacyl-tRNA deacylase n=1 Tax=Sphingopyxis sp. TaxID=1908224 RepID=UPI002B489EC6|nr:YbaK/EbsC family protein [Sphingopyxis sp.]HJS11363.1 YbaK/EbsC family protein [Sphingopyxis sp.]
MTIAPRLRHQLDALEVDYDLLKHDPTRSAMQNAFACQLPPGRIAKAVLIDTPDEYLLAVVPSNRRVALAELRSEIGLKPSIAAEKEVASVFDDCAVGAVPPLGYGYGIATIVDDSLTEQPDVYFEGGDHVSLVHVTHDDFERLMRPARHGRFSERWEDVE